MPINRNQDQISVEQIAAGQMVKYDRLYQLIPYAFQGSTAEEINLYIDLYPIYKTIISRSFRTDTKDYIALVPAIINTCVHYRQFFKKLQVKTNIFLISSYNVNEINRKLIAGYNKTMYEKITAPVMREMVDFNQQLLEILCPYLPDVYFIKTDFESTVVMRHLIEKEKQEKGKDYPHLIISHDLLPAQLCDVFDNVGWLKPQKYLGSDISTIIPPKGHMAFKNDFNLSLYAEHKVKCENGTYPYVSPSNCVLLLAFVGFKQRNIRKMTNIRVACNIINEVAPDSGINMKTLFDLTTGLEEKFPRVILENRYQALDSFSMWMNYKDSIECTNLHYENLIDPGAISMINSQYFPTNPIDVYRL